MALWSELAKANLTSLGDARSLGGGGFGVIELCLVLEELRADRGARCPCSRPSVLGALPIAEFGTPEQQAALAAPVAEQEAVLTAALSELGQCAVAAAGDGAARRRWLAARGREGVRLRRRTWPAAILVPARTDDGVGVFILDPGGSGVTLERAGHDPPRAPVAARARRGARVRRRRAGRSRRRRRDRRLDRRARAPRARGHPGRRREARCADRHLRLRAQAVRAPDRHLPGRGAARGRRLHRRRGHARPPSSRPPGASEGPPGHGRDRCRQVVGRDARVSASCTPRSTCTAASAPTSSIRSTATSCGPSRTSCSSGARTSSSRASAPTSWCASASAGA